LKHIHKYGFKAANKITLVLNKVQTEVSCLFGPTWV